MADFDVLKPGDTVYITRNDMERILPTIRWVMGESDGPR